LNLNQFFASRVCARQTSDSRAPAWISSASHDRRVMHYSSESPDDYRRRFNVKFVMNLSAKALLGVAD
jgi:hypothetical protein